METVCLLSKSVKNTRFSTKVLKHILDIACAYVNALPGFTACGDGGWTTTERYVEILEFTHFTEFWTFNEVGVNHKEKVQVRKVEVSVVLDLDT